MPLDLPVTDARQLARDYLAVVVCQVKFESTAVVSDIETGVQIHQALGGREGSYPTFEPQELRSAVIEVASFGVRGGDGGSVRGWRFRSTDGHWTVTVMPDHASLETSRYTTWGDDFRLRLAELLHALTEHVNPRAQQRLGLRYINRLPVPESGRITDWASTLRTELLGPLVQGELAAGAISAQQQIELDVGGGIGCTLRHGTLRELDAVDAQGYLLDIDAYLATPQLFAEQSALEATDALNAAALGILQSCLTPEYLRRLQSGDGNA